MATVINGTGSDAEQRLGSLNFLPNMALRQNQQQVSPLRLKITLLIAGFGPLVAIGLWLQSKGFFN